MAIKTQKKAEIYRTISGAHPRMRSAQKAAGTIYAMGLVYFDSNGQLTSCADLATAIAGVSNEDSSAAAGTVISYYPVDDLEIAMCVYHSVAGNAVTAQNQLRNYYGLEVDADGKCFVAIENTASASLLVVDFHPADEIGDRYGRVIVRVLPSANQLSTVYQGGNQTVNGNETITGSLTVGSGITMNGGGLQVNAGEANNLEMSIADRGATDSSGGFTKITAGKGNGTGDGGDASLFGGAGGAAGNGGAVNIGGGAGGATSGDGGVVSIEAGDATTDGAGGLLDLVAGDGAGTNAGGNAILEAGDGGTGAGGDGGKVEIEAGNAGTGSGGDGGDIVMEVGAGDGGGSNGQILATGNMVLTGSLNWLTENAGAKNVYTATPSPAWTAYNKGMLVFMTVGVNNDAASTLNVNALGAKDIKTASGADPAAADLITTAVSMLVYDGTNFVLINPATTCD